MTGVGKSGLPLVTVTTAGLDLVWMVLGLVSTWVDKLGLDLVCILLNAGGGGGSGSGSGGGGGGESTGLGLTFVLVSLGSVLATLVSR